MSSKFKEWASTLGTLIFGLALIPILITIYIMELILCGSPCTDD